jgi:GT2 family glycosyltransferase
MEDSIKCSVIICTYNRAEFLEEALLALEKQTVDSAAYELIVVDNNSNDATQEVGLRFQDKFKHYKLVKETKQGLSHARNRGAAEASVDWLFYLDDDAKAHEDMIEEAIKIIDNYDYDVFGGIYLPWYKYGKPYWLERRHSSNEMGKPEEITELVPNIYLSGGIFLIKKEVLNAVGNFDPKLGMVGKKINYGEETAIQIKARSLGYKIGFNPHMKMDHVVNVYKLNFSWFMRSGLNAGKAYWLSFGIPPSNKKVFIYLLSRFYRNGRRFFSIFVGKINPAEWFCTFIRELAYTYGMWLGKRELKREGKQLNN